jgi:hypothetical protein
MTETKSITADELAQALVDMWQKQVDAMDAAIVEGLKKEGRGINYQVMSLHRATIAHSLKDLRAFLKSKDVSTSDQ